MTKRIFIIYVSIVRISYTKASRACCLAEIICFSRLVKQLLNCLHRFDLRNRLWLEAPVANCFLTVSGIDNGLIHEYFLNFNL